MASLQAILKHQRLCWLGHVFHMDTDDLPQQTLYGELPNAKCIQEHPRYTDVCWHDLKLWDWCQMGWLHHATSSGSSDLHTLERNWGERSKELRSRSKADGHFSLWGVHEVVQEPHQPGDTMLNILNWCMLLLCVMMNLRVISYVVLCYYIFFSHCSFILYFVYPWWHMSIIVSGLTVLVSYFLVAFNIHLCLLDVWFVLHDTWLYISWLACICFVHNSFSCWRVFCSFFMVSLTLNVCDISVDRCCEDISFLPGENR